MCFYERLLVSPKGRELECVPLMRRRKVRIELHRALELAAGGIPFPRVDEEAPREGGVRLGESIVEAKRFAGIVGGTLEALARAHAPVIDVERVGIREPGVRECVLRVLGDGALEPGDRLACCCIAALVHRPATAQVVAIRDDTVGSPLERFRILDVGKPSGAERAGDSSGELVLHGEDVLQLTVVALRPEESSVVGGGELRGDAEPVALSAHTALEHHRDVEECTDRPHVERAPLEREDGGARGDAHRFVLVERVDQFIGDAVAQVLVLRVRTGVDEREYGDPLCGAPGEPATNVAEWRGACGLDERIDEITGRTEAMLRNLVERTVQCGLDADRHVGAQEADRARRLGDLARHGGLCAGPGEGRLAGQHLVDDTGEAVHVAGNTHLSLASGLLGTHVAGRSERRAGGGDRGGASAPARDVERVARLGDPKVGEQGDVVGEEDVLRLDIAMHESGAVRMVEGGADFVGDAQRLAQRERAVLGDPVAERAAAQVRRHVVQDTVGLAGIDQWDDVRMRESGDDADLAQEAFGAERGGEIGAQDLDGDLAPVLALFGEVDGGHPAASELALHRVARRERGGDETGAIGHACGIRPGRVTAARAPRWRESPPRRWT